uniref:Uncharacterized protein n=1 Tax=Caenorhabditis japonica TaxID=281687 RepID=A0A8R1HMW7_CAEJA
MDFNFQPTTTYSHRSQKAQTPPATRPAYAQKFTAAAQHLQKPNTSAVIPIPDATKTTPLFLQTSLQEPAGFTPLLTPNSDALLQKKLSEVSHQPVHRGVAAFPAFPQQPESSYLDKETPFSDSYTPEATEGFYPLTGLNPIYDYNYQQSEQDILPLLLDTFKPLPPTQIPSAPVVVPIVVPELLTSSKKVSSSSKPPAAPIKAPRLSDQELECESQKLAIDVISNLFTSKKEIVDRAAVINAPKKPIARNLFCNDQESLVKAKSDDPINMNVLDDWETADDDDLAGRMENLLKDVKKSEQKKLPKPTFTPASHKNPDWDPNFLQHVLEIYGVPDYKMQEDVVKAMETIDYGDCKVSWMERKMVFAVFDSVARAKNCLTLAKHDWLRFRALADSPKAVQDFAVKSASSLTMPK